MGRERRDLSDNFHQESKKKCKVLHGLTRTAIQNIVIGVSSGWTKELKIVGIGYRAQLDGNYVKLDTGYSNSITLLIPPRISIQIENPTTIIVSGMEKAEVGLFAAQIRA